MKLPKTINGYISLLRQIEAEISPCYLKGFDKLSIEDQEIICLLDTDLSNYVNEIKYGKQQ